MNIDFSNSAAIAKVYPTIKARLETVRAEYDEAAQWCDEDYELNGYRTEIEILNGIVNTIDAAYLPHYFDKG